ncbi:hypothetical protein BLNAU_16455 [Blattamonas nauphoetae]|uniref:TraD/TraG TraM recognition site domain-containing protein n=1 Tax=Blattamonas nauphoetae TaxID=2049346 RepID=A0ABQ9X8A8_9EUKA|nr:hypothetical protein BLNAU_16455 [Blattamonas nauphoetae]
MHIFVIHLVALFDLALVIAFVDLSLFVGLSRSVLIINTRLMEDDYYRAFYVNGHPGIGKSQMLIYLIHCLMKEVDKVAIIYVPIDMPVITILVDRSDGCNPIKIRCHNSSLGESWYSGHFPVIRIVDSVDPFANETMQDVFTVYAASPTQFEQHMEHEPRDIMRWKGDYPFWTEGEFYTMMQCLELTSPEFWIRPVATTTIVNLHPLVVTLLGTHGYLTDGPKPSSGEGQLSRITSPHVGMSPELADTVDMQGILNSRNNLFIRLNVIEVFGLSPRALSADLDDIFDQMNKVFGVDGFTLTGPEASLVFSTLAATHIKDEPVSEFASRLLTMLTRIQAKDFPKEIGDGKMPGPNRRYKLKHKVNEDLLRSHSRFTLYSTTPDLFPTSYCTFPVIDRRAVQSAELDAADAFANNVLYYESLYDSALDKEHRSWKGIDSFIVSQHEDSFKLLTFRNAVNSKHKPFNSLLIERLKNLMADQHTKTVRSGKKILRRKAEVDVYFIWIVRSEDVKKYIDQHTVFQDPKKRHSSAYLPFKTGVVSVSDLLLNEFSGLKGPLTKRPKVKLPWTKDSPEFRECFVMKKEMAGDQHLQMGIEMQPIIPQETTPQPHADEGEIEVKDETDTEEKLIPVCPPKRKSSKAKNKDKSLS